METGNDKTSHWDLERLLRGELPEKEAAALRARIASTPALAKLWASMQEERPSRSFRDLQRKAESLASAQAAAQSVPRGRQRDSGLVGRVREWLSGVMGPRLVFGMAMLLVLGVSLRVMVPGLDAPDEPQYSVKGEAGFEAVLRIGSEDLEPDVTRTVKGADTIRVSYRSSQPRFVQLWYQEDDKAAAPLQAGGDTLPPWAATTKWTLAPKKLLLTGEWKRQSLFVVSSGERLSPSEALAAISGDASASVPFRVARFRLTRQP